MLAPAPALSADVGCGHDTDLNTTVDQACPSPDTDLDGYATDGVGDMGTGTATVNGAQTTVSSITVNSGHTFRPGMTASFFDSVSMATITRDVLYVTDVTIYVSGAAVTVANGATISAAPIYDCDDTNPHIYPGIPTTIGCSAGNYHTCQKNGSYDSCAPITGFTCHTAGVGQTYFVDDAVSTCTNSGLDTSHPKGYLCFSNSALAGYHAPGPGDCIAHLRGAYSGTWTPDGGAHVYQIFLIGRDGTPAAPVKLTVVPGDTWWEAGIGSGALIHGEGYFNATAATVNGNQNGVNTITVNSGHSVNTNYALSFFDGVGSRQVSRTVSGTTSTSVTVSDSPVNVTNGEALKTFLETIPVDIQQSDHVQVSGFEIDQKTGGFANSGIHYADSQVGGRVFNNYIHGIDGEEDNNLTCVKFRAGSNFGEVDHNTMKDCYERSATEGDPDWNSTNNSEFRSMDCDGLLVHHNDVSAGSAAAMGISFKHAVASAKGVKVYRNTVFDLFYEGLGLDGIPNSLFNDNWVEHTVVGNSGAGIALNNYGGGTAIYDNVDVSYNTVKRSGCLQFIPEQTSTLGRTILNFHHNVCSDDRATGYPADGTDGMWRDCFYCDDTQFTRSFADTVSDYNCYFNTASTPLFFTAFGDAGSGAAGYNSTTLATWKSDSGKDTNSFNENPTFNAYGQATSTNCTGKGVRLGPIATPTPTPTPSPTPTPVPQMAVGFRGRFK